MVELSSTPVVSRNLFQLAICQRRCRCASYKRAKFFAPLAGATYADESRVRAILLILLAAACSPGDRPTVATRWTTHDPNFYPYAFAVDPAGDIYTADDQSDQQDVWIAKRKHENGETAWTIHITAVPGAGTVWMPHLGTDHANNVLVTGIASGQVDFGGAILTSSGGAFAAKFAPDGQLLWASPIGIGCGLGITASPNGRVYAIGDCAGTISFGASTVACAGDYLAAFEPDGTPRWIATYTWGDSVAAWMTVLATTDAHVGLSITSAESASLGTISFNARAGAAAASFTSDGEPEWAEPVLFNQGVDVAMDSLGDTVATDSDTIASFDPAGSRRWKIERSAQPARVPGLSALAVTPGGTIVGTESPAEVPTLALYGDDGRSAGERWLAIEAANITALATTDDGALVFVASGGFVGLTEPIE
jgi:hypothetical protein